MCSRKPQNNANSQNRSPEKISCYTIAKTAFSTEFTEISELIFALCRAFFWAISVWELFKGQATFSLRTDFGASLNVFRRPYERFRFF